jgi:hypothetical protein
MCRFHHKIIPSCKFGSVVTFSRAMRIFPRYLLSTLIALMCTSFICAQESAMGFGNYRSGTVGTSFFPMQPAVDRGDSLPIRELFQLLPLANLNAGFGQRPVSVSWLGGELRWNPARRWSFQAGYLLAGGFLPSYLERRADSEGYLSGIGYAVADTMSHLYHSHYTFGRAKYNAGKHVEVELGKGKHFWGDGYRSLILSDHASPAPYFKLTTTLGKFRYMNLWMQLRDISAGQTLSNARVKYSAMHAFSYQITPKLNVSLYEWVVWQNRDTLSNRGLDLYYLNPLIFYRPVEYSLGSPDNVMLAASLRWSVTNSLQLYGQFVLDEFNVKLYKRSNNWWGNKIAGQLGLRWNMPGKGLEVLAEVNVARPFIYSHGSSIQAWTHINQSMGHPLGSNFVEACLRLRYVKRLWTITEQLNAAAAGRDYDANRDGVIDNFGGNITRSYANPYGGNFGHELLQGEMHRTAFHGFTMSRALSESSRWEVYVRHNLRAEKVGPQMTTENWFMLGIQTRGMLQPVQDY